MRLLATSSSFLIRCLVCLPIAAGALAQTVSFSAPLSLPAQKATLAITAADFNGDGLPDIAVANGGSSNVSVFLGASGGTFSTAASISLFPLICQPAYMSNGNFTGGPGPDLLVVCPLGAVVVVPNNGHGTFGTPLHTTLPAPAWVGNLLLGDIHPAIGDFNGDGYLDLAVPTFDVNSATGNWLLLLGNGKGSFQQPSILPFTGIIPLSIAAGDFNGDGKLDLVTAVYDSLGTLSLEFAAGKGDGTFQAPVITALPTTTGSLIVPADINGDGKLDLLFGGPSLLSSVEALAKSSGNEQSAVTVFLGDGKGGFTKSFDATEPVYVSGVSLAKILGTGKLDLVETSIQGNFFAGDKPSGAIEVRPGNGDGTFGNPVALPFPSTTVPTDVVTADFNGDGRPDIAISSLPTQGVVLADVSLDSSLVGLLESVFEQLPNGDAEILLNQTAAPAFTNTNAASFATGPLASGSIVSAFGSGLAGSTASATSLPLPTTLANLTIAIKDASGASAPAPLFYVSPQQINYAIPDATAAGSATITIQSEGKTFTTTQQIVAVAPGLFSDNGMAAGSSVQVVNGVQQVTPLVENGALVPIDVSGGQTYLVLYGTGIRNHAKSVVATAGSAQITAAYAGAQGVYLGEDQINIQLPASLKGAGKISVSLLVDGQSSNPVQVLIQ